MAKKLDLAGQRYGKLTVLRPAENIGDRTAWVCRCDCGQETIVRTIHLRCGRIKTCGHQINARNHPWLDFVDAHGRDCKKLDLTGQRFGSLTVLRPAENIGDCTAWVCRCDCRREITVKTTSLQTGNTKTCSHQYGVCPENLQNRKVFKNNTSGVSGVEWLPRKQQWKASICFKRKRYYLGSYSRFEDAVKARKQAEMDLRKNFLYESASTQVQSANS